jgi:hypothetical protein
MIKKVIIKKAGRGGLILRKYSPEILMGVGIVGIIGSTVLACKATLKAEETVDRAKGKFDKIHEAKELIGKESYMSDKDGNKIEYTEQDYKKDLTVAYVQTGVTL